MASDSGLGHDINDLYSRLGTVEQQVAAIGPVLKNVSEDLNEIKRQRSQPFNWIGLGSLVIAMLLYVQTMMAPITEKADQAMQRDMQTDQRVRYVESTAERTDERSRWLVTEIQNNSDRLDRKRTEITSLEERVSRLEGLNERLTVQVDKIDSEGSRRWNEGKQ